MLKLKLFSKEEKKEKEKRLRKRDIAKLAGAGTLAVGVGGVVNGSGYYKVAEDLGEKQFDKEGKVLIDKLKNHHNDIKINRADIENAFYNPMKKDITLGKKFNNAAILSHEMGHAANMGGLKKDKGTLIGRVSHKFYSPIGQLAATNAVTAGSGLALGYKSVDKDEEGNIKLSKNAKRNALISGGIAGLATIPMLTAEAAASKRGLRMLKNQGASKEYLDYAKKSLGHAHDTYKGYAVYTAGRQALSHSAGMGLGYVKQKLSD